MSDELYDILLRDENGEEYASKIKFAKYFAYDNGAIGLENETGGLTIFEKDSWLSISFGELHTDAETMPINIDGVVHQATGFTINPTCGTMVLQTMVVETQEATETFNSASPPQPRMTGMLILADSQWDIVKTRMNVTKDVKKHAHARALAKAEEQLGDDATRDELTNLANSLVTQVLHDDVPQFTYVIDKGLQTEQAVNVSNVQTDPRFPGVMLQKIRYDEKAQAFMSEFQTLLDYTTIDMDTGEQYSDVKEFSVNGTYVVNGTEMHYEPTNGTISIIGFVSVDGGVDDNGQPVVKKDVKSQHIRRGGVQYVTIRKYGE